MRSVRLRALLASRVGPSLPWSLVAPPRRSGLASAEGQVNVIVVSRCPPDDLSETARHTPVGPELHLVKPAPSAPPAGYVVVGQALYVVGAGGTAYGRVLGGGAIAGCDLELEAVSDALGVDMRTSNTLAASKDTGSDVILLDC